MLTLPSLVDRSAQPYVAIREKVTIPFTPVIDTVMQEVAGWLQDGVRLIGGCCRVGPRAIAAIAPQLEAANR